MGAITACVMFLWTSMRKSGSRSRTSVTLNSVEARAKATRLQFIGRILVGLANHFRGHCAKEDPDLSNLRVTASLALLSTSRGLKQVVGTNVAIVSMRSRFSYHSSAHRLICLPDTVAISKC